MPYWDYTETQSLIADETSRTVTLSAASVGLLTCVLTAMEKRYQWRNGGIELTDAQWNIIDAQLANTYVELMTEVT